MNAFHRQEKREHYFPFIEGNPMSVMHVLCSCCSCSCFAAVASLGIVAPIRKRYNLLANLWKLSPRVK